MAEAGQRGHNARRIALACDSSEDTRHAFVWCLSQLCHPDDVLVLIHVASRAEDESHENYNPQNEQFANQSAGAVDTSEDGASKHDTEIESCSLSGGWKVLMKYIRICKQADLACMAVLTRGDPASSFVEAATAHDCDMAAVGSRCLGTLKRSLGQSFSAHAVQRFGFPVVVVRWGIAALDQTLLNAVPPGLEEAPVSALTEPGPRLSAPRRASLPADKEVLKEAPRKLSGDFSSPTVAAPAQVDLVSERAAQAGGAAGGEMPRTASSASEGEGARQERRQAGAGPGAGGSTAMTARFYRGVRLQKKRRIAVGVDGSSGSKQALRWAIENFFSQNDVILLINCQKLQFNPGAGYGAGKTFLALEQKKEEQGRDVLRKYAKLCKNAGVKCLQIIVRGDPKAELAQVSEKHKCHVTVLGAHGVSHDKRKARPQQASILSSLFGSSQGKLASDDVGGVCSAVVHRILLPVVVVRKQDRHDA